MQAKLPLWLMNHNNNSTSTSRGKLEKMLAEAKVAKKSRTLCRGCFICWTVSRL